MTTSCVNALVLRLLIILFLVLLMPHPSSSRNLKGEEAAKEAARKEKMEEARVAQERQSNVNLSKNKIPTSGEKELQMSQRQDEKNRPNNRNHSSQETNKWPKREKMVPKQPTKEYFERLCKRKFLFIISSGRSGSTSLLNMVNELPGYSISGEHWGQFLPWHDLYRRFVRTQGRHSYSDYQIGEPPRGMVMLGNAWEHQRVQDVEFFEMMQDWYYKHTGMRNTNSEYSEKSRGGYKPGIELVKGCKEIRYTDANALDFISHAFPCAKFIFNCRKELFREQKHSAFYRKMNSTEDDLRREAKFLMEYHQSDWMKGRSIIMHMEDFSNMTIWNQMAIFLERPHCRFTDVYHDNNGGYNHERKKGPIVQCSQPNSRI